MNLIIDNYETKNFDISPLANEAFSALAARKFDEELGLVREAAQHLDKALAVVRKTTLGRKTTDQDLDKFDEHATQAEEILDELGELEEHYYIRDFHEAGMIAFNANAHIARQHHEAVDVDWLVVLTNLICLRHVLVEVVLAVKRAWLHGAIQC